MERSHWNAADVVEIYRDLAEHVFRTFPLAAVVIVPFGVSWVWMRRLGRMKNRWQRV
ncbi:hypothetical protein [Roseimicrobium sp. ORNL1]|uniref:hypothetical protein n=1 Tax=Roseimicrobium sp. ORNL1 TaxID=2711231 RepID=UPI0013E17268|nr:hypothetical protein [Roseimicrobium sp. ORNL1]QIF02100.1 hypothetical protein G5S37_11335 [Roseimicrobium sp. ORNL1]